jgi:hypothetical protein
VNLLFSGGNLRSGSKSPSNEHELGKKVQFNYPILDLVSGSVDSFVLPAGRLKIAIFPVAKEYLYALEYLASTDIINEAKNISIYDLVFEETKTRGTGNESEGNQMLYQYETLAAGTQFFIQINLDNNTSGLTKSAAAFALNKWEGYFGGQGRQGRGLMQIMQNELTEFELYANYLQENKDRLAEGLIKGDFGTGSILCS